MRFLLILITPTFWASSIKNSSIQFARFSLSAACFVIMYVKAFVNSVVAVCSFHIRALVLYSARLDPSIHLKFTDLYLLYHICSFSGRCAEVAAGRVDGAGLGEVWVSGA